MSLSLSMFATFITSNTFMTRKFLKQKPTNAYVKNTDIVILGLTLNGPGFCVLNQPPLPRLLNQDEYVEDCRLPLGASKSVRPHCKFHFWCFKLVDEKKIGVLKDFFFENFPFEIFLQKGDPNFKITGHEKEGF